MRYTLVIDGERVDGASTLDVINPATGMVFETCARADSDQLNAAVAAAHSAFPVWSTMALSDRACYLLAFADALEANLDDMAVLLTKEQGKPLVYAKGEIAVSVAFLRYTAGLDLPLKIVRETENERIIEQRTPLGVVAAITPWNVPVFLLMMKIAPALLAGNTMVAKPAPTTPLTTLLLAEIAAAVLPPGVLNAITDANDLGAELASHPNVAKVSFTGSTGTGKRVMQSAAPSLKRLTLELGGNDAAIVLDDVDVKEVAPKIFAAAMINSGQICLATKRVYAPRALYDDLCAELARLATEAIVGDGLDPTTQFGPVQNYQQFEKIKHYLADAQEKGNVIAGGRALERPGYFVAPTIVRDIPDDAMLVREEQFGPVLPILVYDDLDDAIARANDSEYGLGGTIWAKDVDRAFAIARRITAGTLWINQHMNLPFDIPLGGAKSSGIGVQQGMEGLKEFTHLKIINIAV